MVDNGIPLYAYSYTMLINNALTLMQPVLHFSQLPYSTVVELRQYTAVHILTLNTHWALLGLVHNKMNI